MAWLTIHCMGRELPARVGPNTVVCAGYGSSSDARARVAALNRTGAQVSAYQGPSRGWYKAKDYNNYHNDTYHWIYWSDEPEVRLEGRGDYGL